MEDRSVSGQSKVEDFNVIYILQNVICITDITQLKEQFHKRYVE
jgi:hypothetical protein